MPTRPTPFDHQIDKVGYANFEKRGGLANIGRALYQHDQEDHRDHDYRRDSAHKTPIREMQGNLGA